MAHLTFHGVLPTGHRELGDAKGPGGSGVFDMFFESIDLPGCVDLPALIVLATKEVDLDKNFITVNAPETITRMGFDEARETESFVWRILPNPSDTWVLQTHQIPAGRLKPKGNMLGIHTRNDKGEQARVRDDFSVARIFIVYHTVE
jgi:hypothetical protein